IEAERKMRGTLRVFTNYSELLHDPAGAAESVFTQLGISPRGATANDAGDIRTFIDPTLRHYLAEIDELNRPVVIYTWLRETYEALGDLARLPNDEAAQTRLERVRAFFEPAVALFGPFFMLDQQAFADLQARADILNQTLAEHAKRVDTADRVPEAPRVYVGNLIKTVPKIDEQIVRFDEIRAMHDATIVEPNRRLAERDSELMERNSELGVLRQSMSESAATINSLQATISEIYASTSWRFSRPLRTVRRLLDRAKAAFRTVSRFPAANLSRLKAPLRLLPYAIAKGGGVTGTVSKVRDILRTDGMRGLKRALARNYEKAEVGWGFAGRGEGGRIYLRWVKEYDTLDDGIRDKIRGHIGRLRHKPLISVVMPVYNPNPKHLDATIRSVRAQLYPNWELCIADDASTKRKVQQIIAQHVKQDSRIKAVYRETNGHISQATNSALELARGEFVAFLDHDDLLSEHALYWVAAELEAHPQTDILYSDSDSVNDNDLRYGPYFKPDFNLELMLGHNLVNHLGVYRRSLVETIGGMRVGLEGSQDYDLLLRVLGKSAVERIRHI